MLFGEQRIAKSAYLCSVLITLLFYSLTFTKMKKIAFVFAALVAVSFASCKKDNKEAEAEAAAEELEAAVEELNAAVEEAEAAVEEVEAAADEATAEEAPAEEAPAEEAA